MQTQFDHHVRIVSLENLRAMCTRLSGMCHRYEVSKVSRSRVHVTYSNPDEYGNPDPITAVFPCYPSTYDGINNPAVVLGDCTRIIGGREEYDPIQAFDPIRCGLPLYRNGTGDWRTRLEIDGTDRYLCPDGKIRKVDQVHPYTDDRTAAFEVSTEEAYRAHLDRTEPSSSYRDSRDRRHFVYFTWQDLQPVKPEEV